MAKYYSLLPLPIGKFAEEDLSLVDRAVFGMIYDRWRLSSYNVTGGRETWYDYDVDDVYCIFAHDELARMIGVSEKTIRRSLTVLKTKGWIYWTKREYMGANRYFISRHIQEYISTLRKDSKSDKESP
ncbi:MAG: hypothetical protein U0J65_03520 [Christensenellales bacterium]|nr:hypothetical protein [Christensenellales bacterium]